MRAVVFDEGDLRVVERPNPEPGPHDVVVAVHAAGLNAADLLQRQGFYPAPPGWPADVPGLELAGVVNAVGSEVDVPLLGRRVCAIVGGGAQATHCVVPAEHLYELPDDVPWNQAGGFAEAFTTAHDALVTQGRLFERERVLVSGASGGVGTAAVQIAHALGSHVTAVTRTSEHHEQLRVLGADVTITIEQLDEIAPVDVLIELVGAAHLSRAFARLAPRSRVVLIGVGSGSRLEVDLRVIMARRILVTGSTLRARSREEKSEVIERVRQSLLARWTSGAIHVPVARSFDLDSVAEAYDYFSRPGKFGKVILRFEQ